MERALAVARRARGRERGGRAPARRDRALRATRSGRALDLRRSPTTATVSPGTANPAPARRARPPGAVPAGLDGGWSQSFDVLGDGDFDDARVALVLGVPIGNRAAPAPARRGAAAPSGRPRPSSPRPRKAIRAEVLDAAAALETAGQRIEAARAAREAAEVQLAAERERYDVGLSTNFLVLTRQNDLSRARLDEIAALTDYRMARAELGARHRRAARRSAASSRARAPRGETRALASGGHLTHGQANDPHAGCASARHCLRRHRLVKFLQIRAAIAAGRRVPAAAGGGDHGHAAQERVAGDARRHRHRRRGARRHGQRRPARRRRADRLRLRPAGAARATCWSRLDTSQEQAQLAAAEAQHDLARLNLERMRGLREKGVISQAELDRSAAEREQAEARVGEIRGHHRAQDDPGAVRRRPRHPPGQPRPVPEQRRSGRVAAVARPDLRELLGAAAGGRQAAPRRARCDVDGRGAWRAPRSPARSPRVDSVVDEATRNVQVQATLANPEQAAAAGHVRRQVDGRRSGGGTRRSSLPASAISYAPYGDSVFVVEELKGPGRQDLPRRAPAVRQARRGARRPGRGPLRRQARARRSSPRASSSCATAPPCWSTTRSSRPTSPAPRPEDS